ncbi:MAG: hypothetical protein H7Y22_06480 [Gemmatimonadaceae bacterium]|nr:hypothetical protein [Gloeobacterales cyanobacterium ES-bin-141]
MMMSKRVLLVLLLTVVLGACGNPPQPTIEDASKPGSGNTPPVPTSAPQ